MKQARHQEGPGEPSRRSRLCRVLGALDARVSGVAGKLPPRRLTALLLGISVAFALAILAVSAFLEPERSQTLMYALIAIWWIPFSVLSSASAASGRGRCGKRA